MPLLHTDLSQGASPKPPQPPDGWRYADDDVAPDDGHAEFRRHVLWLGVTFAALAAVVGVVLWNAAVHYDRGTDALRAHSYIVAAREFSSATLLIFPYRDAQYLEEQAQRQLEAQAWDEAKLLARVDSVRDAIHGADLALRSGDANGVTEALAPLRAADVRAAVGESPEVRTAAAALAERLTAAAGQALDDSRWAVAGRLAAAATVLEPTSQTAAALEAKARTGQELAARLAKARDAAHDGHWRTALRLALAVTAVREDFPGAATLVGEARKALAPKPKRQRAVPSASPATTTPSSTGGSSSGSSSTPPPP